MVIRNILLVKVGRCYEMEINVGREKKKKNLGCENLETTITNTDYD